MIRVDYESESDHITILFDENHGIEYTFVENDLGSILIINRPGDTEDTFLTYTGPNAVSMFNQLLDVFYRDTPDTV